MGRLKCSHFLHRDQNVTIFTGISL